MKKLLIFFIIFIVAFSVAGCGRTSGKPSESSEPAATDETQVPEGNPEEQGEEADSNPEDEVVTDRIPDNIVNRIENAIACFTIAPQEFSDVSELRDDTMIYAALLRCSGEFLPEEGDEYTYTLPLERLPSAVKAVFGSDAALSDGYLYGSYYPYEISSSDGLIYRYSESIEDNYFYTDKITDLGDGFYEIRLINLRDPLFFDDYEEYLLEGYPATEELIADIRDRMFTYVYTVQDTGHGMIITSFRYLNYKELDPYDFETE